MHFAYSPRVESLRQQLRAFMDQYIVPRIGAWQEEVAAGQYPVSFMGDLKALARSEGLWNLFLPSLGIDEPGMGLSNLEYAPLAEIMGRVHWASEVFNCNAPDTGNMELLHMFATAEQRVRWLQPLLEGEIRSAFAMTEPDVPSSDATNIQTLIRRDGDSYVINGRKWFITGAKDSTFVIIMAKIAGGPHDGEATMFLAPMDDPAIVLESQMDTLDTSFAGGHWNMRFDALRVDADAVLGAPGAGFRYAQVRLAPARLTHCMRWLGSARRAHDTAADYANTRMAFGQVLGKHEGVGFMLADNEMDMRTARLSLQQAAWLLDQGERAAEESSMAKVQCSEAIWRIVDNSVQILGGAGTSAHLPVERIFREVRGFRIYDGPSEVHRWSLARKALKRAAERRAG